MVTGSERLGPVSDCTANCRAVLSSERVPHIKKKKCHSKHVISGHVSQNGGPTPGRTGRLTVGGKSTST
jgi:hypothetical protein